MATNGCRSLAFFDTTENGFYFDMESTDVCVEAFELSSFCQKCLITSNDNKFLLFNEDNFQAMNKSTSDPACVFNIQVYRNNNFNGSKGRAIILYANKEGKKMVACCNEKDEIYPVEMDLPSNIEESSHKAVFYLTQLTTSNRFLFESSVYKSKFLGFKPDEHEPYLSKLVLQMKNDDEVDDSCEVILSNK